MSDEEEEFYKVVLIGQSGVGKTCIINQYINNKFDENTMSTISSQYIRKRIEFPDGKAITFNIFDTAGQEKFRALTRIFYKDANVAILVYDIGNRESFNEMKEYWYKEIKENGLKGATIAIAANKSDLYELRQIDDEEGEEFAKSIGAIFSATSAKNDTGITSLFENIGQKILNPVFNPNEEINEINEKPNLNKPNEKTEKNGGKNIEKIGERTQSFRMNRKSITEGEIKQQQRKKSCC